MYVDYLMFHTLIQLLNQPPAELNPNYGGSRTQP
jgi:hypothetical protein